MLLAWAALWLTASNADRQRMCWEVWCACACSYFTSSRRKGRAYSLAFVGKGRKRMKAPLAHFRLNFYSSNICLKQSSKATSNLGRQLQYSVQLTESTWNTTASWLYGTSGLPKGEAAPHAVITRWNRRSLIQNKPPPLPAFKACSSYTSVALVTQPLQESISPRDKVTNQDRVREGSDWQGDISEH